MSEKTKKDNTINFEIEVDADSIEKAMADVYKRERHKFQMPGFRKGRVPRQILEANYGNDIFFEDAINDLIPDLIQTYIDDNKIRMASTPKVDLKEYYEKGKDLVLIIEADAMPEFEVEGYEGLEADKVIYQITDDMLADRLEAQRKQNARTTIVEDRPIEEGDVTLIDFTGFVDEEEFEGGSGEDYELTIGSGQFIPGFEDQLIGKNLGDEVEVKVTFPEDYHSEDLKGQDAIFDVSIKEIRQIQYPEIDDDFIKDISEFDTVEEFNANTRRDLEDQYKNRSQSEIRQRIMEQIPGLVEFDLPEALVDQQIDREMNNFFQQLSSQGIDVSQLMGDDMSSMRESFRPQAENSLRTELIIEQIAKQEGIEATEDDLDQELNTLADMYMPGEGQDDERKKFIEKMKESSILIENGIIERKTIDLLVEKAQLREISEEDYRKEQEAQAAEEQAQADKETQAQDQEDTNQED